MLADLNEELARLGLAMENLGDIDRQTIAGAISTGTHGTGARLRNISAQVEGLELVLADGSVRQLSAATHPELLRAARVGVGALGAISAVTLRCVPAFTLDRVDTPRPRERGARLLPGARRRQRPLRALHLPLRRHAPWSWSATAPRRRRGRAAGLAAYLNDVVLENWALEALSATGKALPGGDPARSRGSPAGSPPAAARSTAATASSPTSAASASPRWSTACRASTGRRRRGG